MKDKTVLILVNHEIVIYNFRKEIVERLLKEGYRVVISSPYGEKIEKLKEMGSEHSEININRHGLNPLEEIKLYKYYKRLIKYYEPDIILGYTIKPNIYGSFAAKKYRVPFIANVTGLGNAVENSGPLQWVTLKLYKRSFSKIQTVFFQNEQNKKKFEKHCIAVGKHKLLPGSGVNLKQFQLLDYPSSDKNINFVFISRIMKDKGIEEYLSAAAYFKNKHSNVKFHICGFLDGDYKEEIKYHQNKGNIIYHGMVDDIRDVLKYTHCIIHPSYHEGMSNVLLESAASGRPIIASDIPGCRETFDEGTSGFGFKPKNTKSLIDAIEKFLNLSFDEWIKMGISGREKVEKQFNRQIIVEKYLNEIKIATE